MFPHAYFSSSYYAPVFFPPAAPGTSAAEIELGTRVRHQVRRRPQPVPVEIPEPVTARAPVEPRLPAAVRAIQHATPPAIQTAEPSPITIEDAGPAGAADPAAQRRRRIARSNAEIMLLFS